MSLKWIPFFSFLSQGICLFSARLVQFSLQTGLFSAFSMAQKALYNFACLNLIVL